MLTCYATLRLMMMTTPDDLDQLDAHQLRELARQLMVANARKDEDIKHKSARITVLTHEIAILRRHKFGQKSEQFTGSQALLFDETVEEDLVAIELELEQLQAPAAPKAPRKTPRREVLPPELPRTVIYHEPESTTCGCGCQLKRIREDASEKLDYTPGTFSVERHVRGVWACTKCQSMTQAPMPAHVIDKGIAGVGLLSQILISKYADHLPLYRQEAIFKREGMHIPRSSMAQWVSQCGHELQPLVDALRRCVLEHRIIHADETPVRMLKPGSGKTHKAYLWAYAPGKFESLKAVIYDFNEGRAGLYAREFLGDWQGQLLVDDYSGYNALFRQGVTELGCMAHARRKYFDLHKDNQSPVGQRALELIGELYDIERQAAELAPSRRLALRQERAKPLADALHAWMLAQRQRVLNGTGTAKALDYSLKRWAALTRYLDDPFAPIDNNHIEQQIRPVAVGRNNWLFAGSLRAGKRAAAIMSLIQSAKLNGLNPHAYLKDVLTRLPTHPNHRIDELLPHNWAASQADSTEAVSEKISA